MEYRLLDDSEYAAWDHFVGDHPESSIYHFSSWRHILSHAFEKKWYVVGAIEEGQVHGGVPLVHMRSALFGNYHKNCGL